MGSQICREFGSGLNTDFRSNFMTLDQFHTLIITTQVYSINTKIFIFPAGGEWYLAVPFLAKERNPGWAVRDLKAL